MQSANDIRKAFLDFFAGHGHEVLDSGPLVPRNDPTLMFASAGMVQFKNLFTGLETRDYKRAVTSQKCVRAGGKHNDLENVGLTARHHTFFEMLGNFSFGDYFKDLAIELAWTLVTREFGLSPDRLLVTVYADDDEAFDLWRKISGLPDGRILRIATSDNFWSMGDTGPCGPCSEIFYDHGEQFPGAPPGGAGEEGDRFVEIWNLVFMQFEQLGAGERIDLPSPCVDTGMGLERTTAVLQGTHDNYEIDLLRDLILASAEASGVDPDGRHKVSHRVIADHLRASGFIIAGGVLPSNEGRGYVLRRIMRRAMRHAQLMGCEEPLLWRLVPALTAVMGQAYPELVRAQSLITETLKLEETRFKRTLERGLGLLDKAAADLTPGAELPGDIAFKLYDTYGFPLDLTQDALRAKGLAVDVAGFDAAMERQRADARKAWAGSGDAATEEVWFAVREETGATEFLGHETDTAEGKVTALVADGKRIDEAGAGADIAVVVNQTPFYGEAGGQVGDTGVITTAQGARLCVTDTQKKAGGLHVHMARVEEGKIRLGDDAALAVDGARRQALRANHSATHLLHAALRRALGDHVTQKGSLVAPDRLRFDISHPKAVEEDEIAAIEAAVNAEIRRNDPVQTHLMDPEEAIEAGAMALFGEKYGEEVRVVSMGGDYSTELCGGTHVQRAGDIGVFKVVSESAVAAGVRRIEALTGAAAFDYMNDGLAVAAEVAATLKASLADVPGRVRDLMAENRNRERQIADLRRRAATAAPAARIKEVGGIAFSPRLFDDVPAAELKGLADDLKAQVGSGVVALGSVNDGKASLVVGVTDDLTDRVDAVHLVRAGSAAVGGRGGGGRPDMAQAGGPDGASIGDAMAAIESALAEIAGNR
ncbi:MAG: alanine--tRNA ligase [Proteobacteria bacterium]|nr:alanine--tRNA ligase [Pseudomonadota bacterium]